MCGIAGILGGSHRPLNVIARRMADAMAARGPDSWGDWSDAASGVALSHRRLAVLDLTSSGHQPMQSRDGRYVVTFNGEIYNHLDLRRELEAAGLHSSWHGSSDTETLLAAISAWGLLPALRKFRGMFAFGLWDQVAKVLTLARDTIGEKPLYYGHARDLFVFASEIKAFAPVPGWTGQIDSDALDYFTRYSYIPAPHCIYVGFRKLEAGTYVQLRSADGEVPAPQIYGGVRLSTHESLRSVSGSDAEIQAELERRLDQSVRDRMISDVPIGALFSGGVDSTTIVALMQKASSRSIKTFTVGFSEHEFNEADHARLLAHEIGTDHHEIHFGPREALALIPKLPDVWDEPFADPSQIPSHLVAMFARRHVTVALAGDGGDELFCGYRHYALGASLYRGLSGVPLHMRKCASLFLRAAGGLPVMRLLGGSRTAERCARLATAVSFRTPTDFCQSFLAVYQDAGIVPGAVPLPLPEVDLHESTLMQEMMELDLRRYLPENIMTKSDRASMGVALEMRAPFLDPSLVDFARSLPLHLKYRDGVSKWVLKQVLYKLVPRDLADRPKAGFSVPIAHWLKHDLQGWAEDLLSLASLNRSGVFDAVAVRKLWREHKEGKRMRQRVLWNVLMFQAWWFARQTDTLEKADA